MAQMASRDSHTGMSMTSASSIFTPTRKRMADNPVFM
jgi:hypothetical protein